MRLNLPANDSEYVLKDWETIVSKTDLQGNITYINEDFVRISGFSEQELLGSPQNIVRHPDMPREAFEDFWRTLKEGKAWTGLVKNRSKNGDFYWVEANAAPLIEDGRVTGYTSIRIKPSRAQIEAADQAYRAIRAGGSRLEIREGQVVRRASFGRRASKNAPSLRLTIQLYCLVLGTLFLSLLLPSLHDNRAQTLRSLLTAGVGILACGLFSALLRRRLILPLDQLRHDVERMSTGDLTGKIDSLGSKEIGKLKQALRILQTNIKLLVGQIKEAAERVHEGSQGIAASTTNLAEQTEKQASSVEETAASMDQLMSAVRQSADNARQANELVTTTSALAAKGGDAMGQVVRTMSQLRENSRKMADIVASIDSIAFQTNILALNAAVEAAHAGTQGQGFAVVAREVRDLAQRTTASANEIKTLIDTSVRNVETSHEMVSDAGNSMDVIVNAVRQAASYVGEITAASIEQSDGIAHVGQAVTHIDGVTQRNARMVEQSAEAARLLQEQAESLASLVGAFKLVPGAPSSPRI